MKKLWESKTIQVFGAIGIVAVALALENLLGFDLGTGIALREAAGAAVVSAIALGLRFITSEGVTL
ncbi:hypothetical protein LCGC14_1346230 [marine sediment metagenome]|uniref:Uncharacterized protein n=1 Tax=marine sediment metagenome TaxID=412755 RepID=A0A0F9NEL6_9ZZZZ